ncbi:glycosyltransferase family 4 protein [Blastococcus xanthinilyticus]|uniref:Glycosyltransferase involved in cell wall biosynthesis n=1 Tax=Blastococcus xanthinilyticus TaxID=1564164 RepID=A0A5S5D4Z0_9ACTN|nr:glycosyltransferase family 4 protein [Blastococcus xanthinilyticus]TYP89862.1 glycosyltransferase involved in cell wall biosynthesis [Blastococcus xanthinilyticus]
MTGTYDVLIGLNYYAPYVSGLTNVARDVAVGLVERGHRVKVVTSRHDPELPPHETLDGVDVERTPVVARFGKGVISPTLVTRTVAASRTARVTNLHLPMLEAGVIAGACASPVVVTYHCDVSLPPGALNAVQRVAVDASSRRALRKAAAVVVTSDDYARHSRLWPAMEGRTVAIPPSCHQRPAGTPRFRDGDGLHVGFLGRIVEEKGLQFLVRGFQEFAAPDSRLVIGGDFANVAGGSVVDEIRGLVDGDPRIRMLGFLPDEDIADFYASLDVFALPSINAFEAFGIVQVEAMMTGVPALASDLPGVRTPVQETGFGVVVRRRDASAIAEGLRGLAAAPPDRAAGARKAQERYGLATVLDAYEELLERTAR